MAIDDILRLQATTFAMAMRKNANGPGGGKNEAYSRCRYLDSLVMGLVEWVTHALGVSIKRRSVK